MTDHRPFRFGVQFRVASSSQGWAETARKAEALGYDTLVVPDHADTIAFGPALAAVAAATSTLRIGTLVLDNDFRHPALLARDAATLDLLSDGRFELGLGAGWLGSDYTATGIPFESPGVRLGRLRESVAIIKALFGGEPVTFRGQHYTLTDHPPLPRTPQRPHPPILIGAGGRRMLAFAAREADSIGLLPVSRADGSGLDVQDISAAATDQKVAHVRATAGARFPSLELAILVQALVITNDAPGEARRLAGKWDVTAEDLLGSPETLIGSIEQIVETLHARRERFGISYVVVRGDCLDDFGPIVARLAGT